MGALDRALSTLLLGLMLVGSFALWIGVPAGVLWALGEVVRSKSQHLLLGLLAVPSAMILFGALLGGLNTAYMRLNAVPPPGRSREAWVPTVGGPLEHILAIGAVIAILSLLMWLIFGSAGTAPLW